VLDSADSTDDEDEPSYFDLGFFIPDVLGVHVIITSWSSMARDMANLEAVEVGEIGDFLYTTGQWSDVFDIYNFHFKNLSEILGEENPLTLTSMNNLAAVLRDQGKYEQAGETQRQTLGLQKTVLGKEHPETLRSMNNLAMVLAEQGKYEQAEEMHRQTLRLQETMLSSSTLACSERINHHSHSNSSLLSSSCAVTIKRSFDHSHYPLRGPKTRLSLGTGFETI